MYSLNAPAPGRVKRLAAELHPRLVGFDRVRERHSLVCKRFETEDYDRLEKRARRALVGAPAVEARATTIDSFDDPVRGPGPVVYLGVESPGLFAIHERLTGIFGAIPGLEGPDYVPHITLARDGSSERVRELRELDIVPIEWTISELVFFDFVHDERVGSVSLPVSR